MRAEDSTEAGLGTGAQAPLPGPPAEHANRGRPPVVASDTRKNRVLIFEDRVQKTFKPSRKSERNARRELEALERLEGLAGIPVVLELDLEKRTVVLSRVPGRPLTELARVQDPTLLGLRRLVEAVLERGVARHSLPPRDVLVAADGSVGLVDFERSTCRRFPGDPIWAIAKLVTRFHVMRLVHGRAPHLLSGSERRRLRALALVRAALQGPDRLKKKLLRALRRA